MRHEALLGLQRLVVLAPRGTSRPLPFAPYLVAAPDLVVEAVAPMKDFEARIEQRIADRLVREPIYEEDVPAGVIPLSVELPDSGRYEVEW